MNTDAGVRTTIPPPEGLASVYIPSLTDGFGDRLLMFDNTNSDPLEMLRFHAALVDTPGFEEVLRERVRRLGRLTDPAFPTIRAVKRLESDGSLVLVSTYAPGKRLSALLAEPRAGTGLHPAFVAWIVTQVIQPLSILQSEGKQFAHGALTADRIILTDDGRVQIAEHVLGSALHHLTRPPARLWEEFGVLVPPGDSGIPHLDARTDVFQVGALALSMLLARRITPADVERRLPLLLDEWSRSTTTRSRPFADTLRLWIERALQVGDGSYCSAAEAYADLGRLPEGSLRPTFTLLHSGGVNELTRPPAALPPAEEPGGQESEMPHGHSSDEPAVMDPPAAVRRVSDSVTGRPTEMPPAHATAAESRPTLLPFAAHEPPKPPRARHAAKPTRRAASSLARHAVPIAATFGVIAVLEAIVIAMLLRERPAEVADAVAALSSPSAAVASQTGAPLQPASTGSGTGAAGSQRQRGTTAAPVDGRQNTGAAAAAIARTANNQRSGGMRLTAPIELQVLQGDRVLGSSTDGPILTAAGTHELDFINTSLGFRTRRTVTFRAGEITTLSVPVPPGRISVNAEPWAEVWIDNQSVGETPLAHLEVPVGEHEVIFRHPEFGERRQHVIVRADGVTRASTTFDR